ncbi:hypothetical protein ACWKWN_08590 [Microbacterium trichothecenolyticum]
MAVTFSGQRPSEELNGLEDLHDAFMKADADDVIAVVVVRRAKRVLPDDKDGYPVVRFARIEPVAAEDVEAAQAILERAYSARTGAETLDLGDAD